MVLTEAQAQRSGLRLRTRSVGLRNWIFYGKYDTNVLGTRLRRVRLLSPIVDVLKHSNPTLHSCNCVLSIKLVPNSIYSYNIADLVAASRPEDAIWISICFIAPIMPYQIMQTDLMQ